MFDYNTIDTRRLHTCSAAAIDATAATQVVRYVFFFISEECNIVIVLRIEWLGPGKGLILVIIIIYCSLTNYFYWVRIFLQIICSGRV